MRRSRYWITSALLFVASAGFSVFAIEVACRLFEVDFSHGLYHRLPVFYREPSVPTGEAFFRREGYARWRGRPRATMLKILGSTEKAYEDDPVITVQYDKDGFRNPDDLDAWDLVVLGDSFTELGHLPDEELFTSLVAEQLGIRVKNLSVSSTGTFAQIHYLREYGRSPQARQVVLAFFEGNDLENINAEAASLEWARKRGQRPEQPTIESSFIRALANFLWIENPVEKTFANAVLDINGETTRLSLLYAPSNWQEFPAEYQVNAKQALREYAETASGMGLTPWLLYLPCKHRVLHDGLTYLDSATPKLKEWQPSDLPQQIEKLCEANDIRFVDATACLQQGMHEGDLPYSTIYDSHLNRLGSQIVAQTLASALASDQN